MKKNKKNTAPEAQEEILNIPEDEIWNYKIDGLAEPRINYSYKNKKGAKIALIIFIIASIIISLYFSVRALLNTGKLEYNQLDSGSYELKQFSNNGFIKEFTVDYVSSLDYNAEDAGALLAGGSEGEEKTDPDTFKIINETDKPVSVIHEYAFNCDTTLEVIRIGANVTDIDAKAIYSCWNLQNIYVDDNNPNYCDIDGVLYSKDRSTIICYPINHDKYLREKFGYNNLIDDDGKPMEELWGTTQRYDEEFFNEYNLKVRTYVIPSSVTKIGDLCFNYANLVNVYMPEGIKELGTLAFFDAGQIRDIYSYKNSGEIKVTDYTSVDSLKEIYKSLPDGLEKIGSDCFTKDRGLSYMYIPSSVIYIGHHAFWDCVYKENGDLVGISEINIQRSEEDFNQVQIGKPWLPKYDYMLFKKNVNLNYSAER